MTAIKIKYDHALISKLCPVIGLCTEDQRKRFAKFYGYIVSIIIMHPKMSYDILGYIFSFFCHDYGLEPSFHTKRIRDRNEESGYRYLILEGPNPNCLYNYQPVPRRVLSRTVSRYRLKAVKRLFKQLVEQNEKVEKSLRNLEKAKNEVITTLPFSFAIQKSHLKMREAQKELNVTSAKMHYGVCSGQRNATFAKYHKAKEKSIVGDENKRSYRNSVRQPEVTEVTNLDYERLQNMRINVRVLEKEYKNECKKERNRISSDFRREQRRKARAEKSRKKEHDLEYFNSLPRKK